VRAPEPVPISTVEAALVAQLQGADGRVKITKNWIATSKKLIDDLLALRGRSRSNPEAQPPPGFILPWQRLAAARAKIEADLAALSPAPSTNPDSTPRSGVARQRHTGGLFSRLLTMFRPSPPAPSACDAGAEPGFVDRLRTPRPDAPADAEILRARLADYDLALAALRAGDEPTRTCVLRWDLETAARVASIRHRLHRDGKVYWAEWDYYRSAGNPRYPRHGEAIITGRPGNDGTVVTVTVDTEGRPTGTVKRDYHHLRTGATLASCGIPHLCRVWRQLQIDKLEADVELLEAYLDTVGLPHWRDHESAAFDAMSTNGAATQGPGDPFRLLGVTRATPMAEIAAAFRRLMSATETLPDPPTAQRYLIEAFKAVKAEKAGRTGR
jgi:hypothetical protein